jgi:hypothetical protein
MGVSLGNKSFNGRFARNLIRYVAEHGVDRFVIFLGDFIERINYMTFSGYVEERAVGVSLGRAENLRKMFLKSVAAVEVGGLQLEVMLESELRASATFAASLDEARACLTSCGTDPTFRSDLKSQLFRNLDVKIERFGNAFVEGRASFLKEYILGELEIFYALYQCYGDVLEVYPGPEMVVKQRFFDNFYSCSDCPGLPLRYQYEDVSHLSD